jgi:hypothetical protein
VFFFFVFHRDSVKLKELVKNQMEKKENYHHKKIEAAVSISPINISIGYWRVSDGLKKKGQKGGSSSSRRTN